MAERARTQRAEPIVRLGRRQEKPLDNLEQAGTEVPSLIRGANVAEGQLFIPSKALDSYSEAGSAAPVRYSGPGPKTVTPELPQMQPRRAHTRKRGNTSQSSRVLTVVSHFDADGYPMMKTSGVMMG